MIIHFTPPHPPTPLNTVPAGEAIQKQCYGREVISKHSPNGDSSLKLIHILLNKYNLWGKFTYDRQWSEGLGIIPNIKIL